MATIKALHLSDTFRKAPKGIVTSEEWNSLLDTLDDVFNNLAQVVAENGRTMHSVIIQGPNTSGFQISAVEHRRGNKPIVKTYIATNSSETATTWEEVYDSPIITADGDITVYTDYPGRYLICVW